MAGTTGVAEDEEFARASVATDSSQPAVAATANAKAPMRRVRNQRGRSCRSILRPRSRMPPDHAKCGDNAASKAAMASITH